MSEDVEPERTILRMPAQQERSVPAGWKPTPAKPIPVTQCTVIKKDGERCQQWSMRGMLKCYAHGKRELRFPNVAAHRDAVIEAARMRLLDLGPDAVETIALLMEPGSAEQIRLKAATEVMDRVGIRGGFEVDIEVSQKQDPAAVIAERLATLRERVTAKAIESKSDEDIVDAEVLDQDTLF